MPDTDTNGLRPGRLFIFTNDSLFTALSGVGAGRMFGDGVSAGERFIGEGKLVFRVRVGGGASD